jgi:hypothetical protein
LTRFVKANAVGLSENRLGELARREAAYCLRVCW